MIRCLRGKDMRNEVSYITLPFILNATLIYIKSPSILYYFFVKLQVIIVAEISGLRSNQ